MVILSFSLKKKFFCLTWFSFISKYKQMFRPIYCSTEWARLSNRQVDHAWWFSNLNFQLLFLFIILYNLYNALFLMTVSVAVGSSYVQFVFVYSDLFRFMIFKNLELLHHLYIFRLVVWEPTSVYEFL